MKCKKCNTEVVDGVALLPSVYCSDDFGGDAGSPGCTMSEGPSDGKMIKCKKCPNCGHSFIPGSSDER